MLADAAYKFAKSEFPQYARLYHLKSLYVMEAFHLITF